MQLASRLNWFELMKEVEQIDDFWKDGSGAYMAIRPCHGIPDWLKKCPGIMAALKEISELRSQSVLHVMINKLPPGVIVPVHTDTLAPTRQGKTPKVERWHLPISTNKDCFLWAVDSGWEHMPLGYWSGPVQYWREHSVENTGTTERIHLVVDLDTP